MAIEGKENIYEAEVNRVGFEEGGAQEETPSESHR